jgi:hypothetical protein
MDFEKSPKDFDSVHKIIMNRNNLHAVTVKTPSLIFTDGSPVWTAILQYFMSMKSGLATGACETDNLVCLESPRDTLRESRAS